MTGFKKTLCILLSIIMIVGVFAALPITASAGAPTYFHPGIITAKGYWYAWTWSDSDEGSWRTAWDENGVTTFYGLSDKVVFVLLSKNLSSDELDDNSWGYTVHQSDDLTVNHTKNHFTATKWTTLNKDWNSKNFGGVWSDKEEKSSYNPLTVKAATKSVKASALKKSAKTVKLLTITKAKGSVKVSKVKSGTSSKIYSKISVKTKTGEVKINKGTYKAGTYKIKLKVTASGNADYGRATITKTAKLKIVGKKANPVAVSQSIKDVTIGALKKAKKTVKPLAVKGAKGKLTVKKVKKGTTGSIYKKISVNAKTGAITFAKSTYKKSKYKVKLKVTAKGNEDYKSKSVTKTVTIRIANKFVKCSKCSGTGYLECKSCSGRGYNYTGASTTYFDAWGRPSRTVYHTVTCSVCGGHGREDCAKCDGTGKVMK